MKQKFKHLTKVLILVFGISLFLTNCEKEDESVLIEQKVITNKQPFKITKINQSKIKENKAVMKKIQNINSNKNKTENNTQNRIVYSDEYDFYINTDNATYIENQDKSYHSYTFPIFRNEDNGLLENLLLSLQIDGSYKAFIVSYDLSEQEKEDLNNGLNVDFERRLSTAKIDDIELSSSLIRIKSVECIWVITTFCGEGNHEGGYYNGAKCPAHQSRAEVHCSSGGGGGRRTGGNNDGTSDGCDTCGSNGSNSGGGTTTGDDNLDVTSPTTGPSPLDIAIDNFFDNLTDEQEDCLKTNFSLRKKIRIFLENNMVLALEDDGKTNAENFAIQAIETVCEGGEVNFEDRIFNELTGKAKCLNGLLDEKGNSYVKSILSKFKGNSTFDIKIVSMDKVISQSNGKEINGSTSPPINDLITISISSSKANQRSALGVARTILHEYIHADIFRKLDVKYNADKELDFKKTYQAYNDQHEAMGALYVSSLRDAMKDFHKNVLTDDYNKYIEFFGEEPSLDFYEALAWRGLKEHDVKAWTDLSPERKQELNDIGIRIDYLTNSICPND